VRSETLSDPESRRKSSTLDSTGINASNALTTDIPCRRFIWPEKNSIIQIALRVFGKYRPGTSTSRFLLAGDSCLLAETRKQGRHLRPGFPGEATEHQRRPELRSPRRYRAGRLGRAPVAFVSLRCPPPDKRGSCRPAESRQRRGHFAHRRRRRNRRRKKSPPKTSHWAQTDALPLRVRWGEEVQDEAF